MIRSSSKLLLSLTNTKTKTCKACSRALLQARLGQRNLHSSTPRLNYVPIVVSPDDKGHERTYDIYSRLLKERIVFLNGGISDSLSATLIAQLLFLEAEDPTAKIDLYINSPGGHVTSGLAIYDTMQYISSPVHTTVLGQASSMASLLLAGGEKGHRKALPNASIMIHQPSGGSSGQASDIAIMAEEILRIRERMFDLYADHCLLENEGREDARGRFGAPLFLFHEIFLCSEKVVSDRVCEATGREDMVHDLLTQI
ncbi:hypothetical protein T439DRAFT_321462 [Meredithblackwellia eburnea MCA 4105]